MKDLEEKKLSEEVIFTGKVVQLTVAEVLLPNGEKSTREIVNHPGAVAVIPVTESGEIVCVEQFRAPLKKTIIEIPAGKMEKGESKEGTALRELEEETGYTAKELKLVTSFYTSPGFSNEILYLYLAKDLSKLKQAPDRDADEFLNVVELDIEKAKQLIEKQRIHDAKTIYAIKYMETAKVN